MTQIDDIEIELSEIEGDEIALDLSFSEDEAASPGEINALVEELFVLKTEKSALQEQIKDLEAQINSIEYKLLTRMDELGIDKLSTSAGSVTKATALYPKIEDFNALIEFCYTNNRQDFLQKRVNSAPFKEYFEQYNEYPAGLDGYYKDSLNSRRKR